MSTENQDAPLGKRVTDLEHEVDLLRRRVTELERATGSAAAITAMEMSVMEIAPLDSTPPALPSASAAATPPPIPAPAVSVPVASLTPPPLPVVTPPAPSTWVPPPPVPPSPLPSARGSQPTEPEGPSPLRLFLERLQLWPPSGDENREANLGTWWATRLGTLLLVIGVVFLGVYVSRNTPPWVRFVELLGVSIGVSAFGLWLESRVAKVGAVLFGGGLALLYFCAFGAYAVEPMKLIDNVVIATFCQLVAVVVLSAATVWRRSPVVGTMAIALGYVTAVFSSGNGLPLLALVSALMLGTVAVWFDRRWRWAAPAFVAMPATYVVGALVLFYTSFRFDGRHPAVEWTWLFLIAALVLYFLRDWRGRDSTRRSGGVGERIFQGLNSTFALLLGFGVTFDVYRPRLAEFYFGAAVILAGLAVVRRRQVERDSIGAVLLAKAAGALTLGVIEVVEGRTTAIALLVQAWVLLFAAWRMKARVLEFATGAVAVVACWFFARDAEVPVPFVTLTAAGTALFVVGLALLATEMARRLFTTDGREMQIAVELVGALGAGVLGLLAAYNWLPTQWRPAMLIALLALFAAAAYGRRAWGPALAGLFPLVAANFALWSAALGPMAGAELWLNAAAVLVPMGIAGAWVGGMRAGWPLQALSGAFRISGAVMWCVGALGLTLVLFNAMDGAAALIAASAVTCGLAIAAVRWPARGLTWVAAWAAFVSVAVWWWNGGEVMPVIASAGAPAFFWALAIGTAAWPALCAAIERERSGGWLSTLVVGAATVVTLRVLTWLSADSIESLVLAVAALAVGALVFWPRLQRALEASWIFWIFAWLAIDRVNWLEGAGSLSAENLLAGMLAWIPVVGVARSSLIRAGDARAPWWRAAEWIQNALAVLIAITIGRESSSTAGELLVPLVAAGFALLAGRWARSNIPQLAAIALLAWAAVAAFELAIGGGAAQWGSAFASVLAVAAGLAGLPFVLDRLEPRFDPSLRHGLTRLFAPAGGALAFIAMAAQRGSLAPYITVGWGLFACLLFVGGLLMRSRPHRLLGLTGLALCIGRVFLVDLTETVHRIVAFVVLGVVLLGVGFFYQKFKHLIVDEAPAKPRPTPPSP